MIEMHVGALALDKLSGEPIVVLSDADNRRSLPIWIGAPEARAIALAVKKIIPPRPLTHDLLRIFVERFGYRVKEIVIDELTSSTYKALIVLARETSDSLESEIKIDARPSDAIALAILANAPLLVSADLVRQASIASQSEIDDRDSEEFKKFLESVKASDFNLVSRCEDQNEGVIEVEDLEVSSEEEEDRDL